LQLELKLISHLSLHKFAINRIKAGMDCITKKYNNIIINLIANDKQNIPDKIAKTKSDIFSTFCLEGSIK
jgi:hypothetical protein